MSPRHQFALGCVLAGLGVIAGAFAAHGLKARLSAEMLAIWETAVRYQMYHAFGIMLAAGSASLCGAAWARRGAVFFLLGIIIFSGSLYLYALLGTRWLGMITPIGGVCFIIGWALLVVGAGRSHPIRSKSS